jgi:hypothetical protein
VYQAWSVSGIDYDLCLIVDLSMFISCYILSFYARLHLYLHLKVPHDIYILQPRCFCAVLCFSGSLSQLVLIVLTRQLQLDISWGQPWMFPVA